MAIIIENCSKLPYPIISDHYGQIIVILDVFDDNRHLKNAYSDKVVPLEYLKIIEMCVEGVTYPATGAVCHYKPLLQRIYAPFNFLTTLNSSFSNMPSETLKIHDCEHFLSLPRSHPLNFNRLWKLFFWSQNHVMCIQK